MGKTSCKKGQYYCNTDQKCKPIPDGYKVREDGILVSEGSLHKWFKGSKSKDGKGGWVNVVTGGTCASDEPGEGTPKCVSSAKRASMSKKERLSAARRKKKADPNQQKKTGAAKPTYVSTDKPKKKKKMKEEFISLPLQLEVPQNDGEFRLGLMFRESLEKDRGMLFVFENTDRHSFHMKNTFIPLDIAFINEEGVIESIKELNPMSSIPVYPDGKIRYAVEVNRGWFAENGVVVGDTLLEDIEEAEIDLTEVKDKKGKGSGTKDACYHKVKSRYSVWPSAYASGALVKCRKVGAANWGNSRKEEVEYEAKVYKTPHHRWRDEIVEHHKKDKDGNTIPHEDEITEMKSNPDYKGVGALTDKSKVQKPDSISIIKPYGSGPMDDKTKEKVKKFARKDVPYQDSKGGHTLSVSPQGNVMNMTKYLRREHYDWRETLDEKCWKGYEKKGMKTMFGKRYPNCVKKTKKEELEVETSYLDEKKKYQGNPFKKKPGIVDKAFDKLDGLIKVKKVGKDLPTDVNEKLVHGDFGNFIKDQKLPKNTEKKYKEPPYKDLAASVDLGDDVVYEKKMTKKQIKKRDEIADAISTKDMKDRYGDKNVKYAIATKLAMKEDITDEALLVQDWNVDEIKYTEVEAVDIIKPEPLKPSPSNEVNEMTGVLVKGASKIIPALMTGTGATGTIMQIKKKIDQMDFGKSKRTKEEKGSARNQRKVANLGKKSISVQGRNTKDKLIFTKKIKSKKSDNKVKKEIISKGFMKDHYDWREDLGEDWQKVNRKDKTDGMSKAAVKAYRRENPGSKLKTAVTKDPKKLKKGSKSAKRRLAFCRRMKGMKKKLTSAKTSRDPDSRINKALRRWNC